MVEKAGVHAKTQETKQKRSNFIKQRPHFNHSGSPAERMLYLQQTAGNQAVQRLVKSRALQAKLTISQRGDMYEQEADRVAEQVMRVKDHTVLTPSLTRSISSESGEGLYCKAWPGGESVRKPLKHPTSGGQSIPNSDRRFFESRFGYDFSQVRIHTDSKAGKAARSVNALAYTMGSDVVFGDGQYRPGTESGRKLLVHELAHVIQQGTAGTPSLQRRKVPGPTPAGATCPIAIDSPMHVDTDVLFSLGSSTLMSTAIADISSFVGRWNAAGANKFVRVDGYASVYEGERQLQPTDPLAVWALSCDRAMNVEQELMTPSSGALGIPGSFIAVFAQGETGEGTSEPPHTRARISAEIPARATVPLGTACLNCPFFCGYKTKPLDTYNCAGLAFRTYLDHTLSETKQVLTLGSDVSCGIPCDQVGMIKFWMWEYDGRLEDSSGSVLRYFPRDFHMVGGPTAGDPLPKDSAGFYSKNHHRKVYGPGTAPSFRPPAKEQATSNDELERKETDNKGNPIYWVRYNLKESCYCFPCPKNLDDALW